MFESGSKERIIKVLAYLELSRSVICGHFIRLFVAVLFGDLWIRSNKTGIFMAKTTLCQLKKSPGQENCPGLIRFMCRAGLFRFCCCGRTHYHGLGRAGSENLLENVLDVLRLEAVHAVLVLLVIVDSVCAGESQCEEPVLIGNP